MLPDTLPPKLRQLVQTELQSDETILWSDTPVARFFTAKSTGVFLFAILWTLFSLSWIAGASGYKIPSLNGPDGLFPLLGVPFVIVGIGMLAYPLVNYRNAFKSCYVLTDRRALTFEPEWTRTTIRSFTPRQLTIVYRKEARDGTGDVIFNAKRWNTHDGKSHSEEIGFLSIAKVREVESMLKTMVDGHRRPRAVPSKARTT